MGQSTSSNRETVEDNYQYFRNLADAEAQKRNECYAQSQDAYKNRQGRKAKELSLEGKEHQRKMQEYNAKAAEIIFIENNKDRPITELDLHGLFVKEAIEKTRLRIEQCERKGIDHLVIIVGVGRHSIDGISKLRPAVLELIKKHNLRCIPNKPTVGCLHVEIGSSDIASEDLSWFQSLFGGGCIIC